MKVLILILVTLVSLNLSSQTLRQKLLNNDKSLEDVEIIKCKADSTLFIAILITNYDWLESIRVIKFRRGKIVWTANFDTLPTSQSILSARQIFLNGNLNPLIEVFDETHIGNGFYYLYELKGKNAKLIASTRAVDDSDDGAIKINHEFCSRYFKDGKLKPTYIDINKDGYTDIKLTGIIQIKGDNYLKEYYAQKVFLYDNTKEKFVEDLKQRKGFKSDDD